MSIVPTLQRRIELAALVQQHAAAARNLVEQTLAEAVAGRHDIGTLDALNRAMQALTRAIQQSRTFQHRIQRKANRAAARTDPRSISCNRP